eukprot:3545194-Amphidinium_carterae.1
MDLMTNILKVSGEKWELEQRAEVIKKLASKGDHCNPFLRQFEVTLAADGVLEEMFYDQLSIAFTSPMWSLIPSHGVSVSINALAFRLLSMQGCLMEQNVAFPHRSFPLAVFKGVTTGHVGQALLEATSCLLDEWSKSLRVEYPDCSGKGFLNCLELHAMMSSCSIACIESRHSTIRRHLVSRSVQTHKLQLHNLSSEFVMQTLRAGKRCLQSSRAGVQKSSATSKKVLLFIQNPSPLNLRKGVEVDFLGFQ